MNKTYIFIHIPKTAGTTLRYHFQKHLIDQKTFIHYANKGNRYAKKLGMLPFDKREIYIRRQAKVILGHNVNQHTKFLVEPNKVVEVVFFRDPNSWSISRYNQYANALILKKKPYLSFQDWLEFEPIQSQFDWFAKQYSDINTEKLPYQSKFKKIMEVLSTIDVVGFVDKLDKTMDAINKDLNVPQNMKRENVTGKNMKKNIFSLNETNKKTLIEKNKQENIFFQKIRNKLTEVSKK